MAVEGRGKACEGLGREEGEENVIWLEKLII